MRRVEKVDIGAKVVRGPDWAFTNQDAGSKYGIIEGIYAGNGWAAVRWIDDKNDALGSIFSYRVGGGSGKYDLAYYEDEFDEILNALEKVENKYKNKQL